MHIDLRLPYHNRYAYSPITERKDYSWPERQAAGGLSRPQHRALRLRRRRRPSADRGRHAARSAHLRLARLRQPGRRVALPRTVRRAQPAGGAPDQHHGVRLRAADRRCAQGTRRRVHRPRPHQRRASRPDVGGRREALPRGGARRHREGVGQAAARLDGAVDEFQPSHARSPEGDGLRLPDGLAGRRPAAVDEDALGPADERALSDRDQRQPADPGAPPFARAVPRLHHRPVRGTAAPVGQAAAGLRHRAPHHDRGPALSPARCCARRCSTSRTIRRRTRSGSRGRRRSTTIARRCPGSIRRPRRQARGTGTAIGFSQRGRRPGARRPTFRGRSEPQGR